VHWKSYGCHVKILDLVNETTRLHNHDQTVGNSVGDPHQYGLMDWPLQKHIILKWVGYKPPPPHKNTLLCRGFGNCAVKWSWQLYWQYRSYWQGLHAGQVKGDDPDKKGYSGPPGWRFDVKVQPHLTQNMFCWESSKKRLRSTRL